MSAAELEAVRAGLDALIRTRESEALALRQLHDRAAGEASSLADRVREAEARVEAAIAGLELAGFDTASARELVASGVSTERDALSATTREREASWTVTEEAASVSAILGLGAGEAQNLKEFCIPFEKPVSKWEEAIVAKE